MGRRRLRLASSLRMQHHRLYLPDFGVDVDVEPGMTTEVRFTPGDTSPAPPATGGGTPGTTPQVPTRAG